MSEDVLVGLASYWEDTRGDGSLFPAEMVRRMDAMRDTVRASQDAGEAVRVVNGETLTPVYAWRWDLYVISTDSDRAAESGLGYFTVARLDPTTLALTYLDRMLDICDAVQRAKVDKAARA